MTDKNKNKKSSLTGFLRYRRNEMTGEERNAFERELQRNPFAEEAVEGFDSISTEEALRDMDHLQKRLKTITSKRKGFIYYRIAASVAVLMVISTIFIVTQRRKQVVTLSENISMEGKAPFSIPIQEPLSMPTKQVSDKKKDIPPPVPQTAKADDQPANIKVAELLVAEPQKQVFQDSEVTKPDPSAITAEEVAVKTFEAEKRMDIARAAPTPANAKSVTFRDYTPAQPVVGKDSFDIYIEKNIRKPESEKSEQQVVVISFKVLIDSTITNIKIINTPGQPYSREAIRLIKEGPAWKPAKENRMIIEDTVRVSIIF